MKEFMRRSVAAFSLLLTGVAVEFVLAIVKDEPVSFQRFGTLLALILVMTVGLELAEKKKITWRRLIAIGLIAIGLMAVAAGVFVLFGVPFTQSETVTNVMGTVVMGCGAIVVISGLYTAMQRGVVQQDDPGEYKDIQGLSQDAPGGTAVRTLTTFDGDKPPSIVRLCQEKLALYDLHFIGYYVNEKCRFYTDILADGSERMHDYRGDVGAETRRKRYEAYGRLTHGFVGRLDKTFAEVEQGNLIRVVLDVAQGAFYYIKIDSRRFVFAVTMNQHAVDVADDKIRKIALHIKELGGLDTAHDGLAPDKEPPDGEVSRKITQLQPKTGSA